MSEASSPSSSSKPAWSARLAERYHLDLPPDLVDWFDSEVWRELGGGEYAIGVDPQVLLGPAPDPIWPALMPPDLLPVVGNGRGDWLCLRVDTEGRVSRIVQWYHGGGDWIPWGRTLAEAIYFDALFERLPGPHRRHALPPEPTPGDARNRDDPFLRWAASHVPPSVRDLPWQDACPPSVADALLDAGACEEAVRCELVQASLVEPLSAVLDPVATQGIHAEWNRVVEWMFDLRRMPAATRQAWGDLFEIDLDGDAQTWGPVREHCGRVIETAPELAWAWELYGYCCHRNGQRLPAIEAYREGALRSVFTDQSIRMRTHWTGHLAAKFSVAMLRDLSPEAVEGSDYLRILAMEDTPERRNTATRYWTAQSRRCLESGDAAAAHAAAVSAGWDLGAGSLTAYGTLLDAVRDSASAAGFASLAELATTHRGCLQSRYAI